MKNRFLGTTLFFSGCCIGAGMLGMPLITYNAGFFPSMAIFVLCFLFMTGTAFLLAETSLRFDEKTSLLMMSEKLLGKWAKWVTSSLFFFLMYALLVAYTIGATEIIRNVLRAFGFDLGLGPVMSMVTLIFGVGLYYGTVCMDWLNRLLMIGLLLGYVAIVTIGAPQVKSEFLQYHNWKETLFIAPIMIISFGYHNLIPSMRRFLPSRTALKQALIWGAAIPLVIYLLWEAVLLGLLPPGDSVQVNSLIANGSSITEVLATLTSSSSIIFAVELFTFCAITTSYIGQSVSVIDLIGDHFKKDRLILVLMTVLPPFLIAYYYPDLFLKALSAAGAYGAIVVFGIIPILMAYKARKLHPSLKPLLGGGKVVLGLLLLFGLTVIILEVIH